METVASRVQHPRVEIRELPLCWWVPRARSDSNLGLTPSAVFVSIRRPSSRCPSGADRRRRGPGWCRGQRVVWVGTGPLHGRRRSHGDRGELPEPPEPSRRGKNDPIDALSAARVTLSGDANGLAKTRNGAVEAIRVPRVARSSSRHDRTEAPQPDAQPRVHRPRRFAPAAATPLRAAPPIARRGRA